MFRAADYTFKWNGKGKPIVTIDLHDGFPEECTEASLVGVIKKIRENRRKYVNESDFTAVLGIYEGALKFLQEQLEIDNRLTAVSQ